VAGVKSNGGAAEFTKQKEVAMLLLTMTVLEMVSEDSCWFPKVMNAAKLERKSEGK